MPFKQLSLQFSSNVIAVACFFLFLLFCGLECLLFFAICLGCCQLQYVISVAFLKLDLIIKFSNFLHKYLLMSKIKERYDYLYKVIIIGDSGVGKTNLILRFSDQNFKESYVATIGVDFKMKTLQLEDKKIKLQLWDTAGQQRFRTITQTYYKGASGIILAYSINDRDSYININKWMKQIREKTPEHVQKMIVANKFDLSQTQRVVSVQQGQKLAEQLSTDTDKINFMEVSAKTGYNIDEAFIFMCKQIKEYNEQFIHEEIIPKKSQIIRVTVHKDNQKCYC